MHIYSIEFYHIYILSYYNESLRVYHIFRQIEFELEII